MNLLYEVPLAVAVLVRLDELDSPVTVPVPVAVTIGGTELAAPKAPRIPPAAISTRFEVAALNFVCAIATTLLLKS